MIQAVEQLAPKAEDSNLNTGAPTRPDAVHFLGNPPRLVCEDCALHIRLDLRQLRQGDPSDARVARVCRGGLAMPV